MLIGGGPSAPPVAAVGGPSSSVSRARVKAPVSTATAVWTALWASASTPPSWYPCSWTAARVARSDASSVPVMRPTSAEMTDGAATRACRADARSNSARTAAASPYATLCVLVMPAWSQGGGGGGW
jgi:hypothetical protein